MIVMESIGKVHFTKKCEFEWQIQNFLDLPMEYKKYKSPLFSFAGESWFLTIYPNGQLKYNTLGQVALYLFKKNFSPPINLTASFSIRRLDGKVCQTTFTHVFEKNEGVGASKLISRSTLSEMKHEFLPSDTLTVFCTIDDDGDGVSPQCSNSKRQLEADTISPYKRICSYECAGATENDSKNEAFRDYKQLLLNKEDCDVIIKVKEKEFQAHKLILKARSPVLCSTFRNQMKENETGIIHIEDCNPDHFQDFLNFLYCGEVEKLTKDNVFGLFALADKYIVASLSAICMAFIKENISVITFCNTINLALLHTDENELLKLSMEFFAKNMKQILVTVEWQTFIKKNPLQCNEIILKALDYIDK